MLLSGFAKMISSPAPFNEAVISSVDIARGRNDKGQSVQYYVLSKLGGLFSFSTEQVARYEINKLNDFEHEESEVRTWILANIEPDSLHKLVQLEKERLLTSWRRGAKKLIKVKFEDESQNVIYGVSENATDDELIDFYVHNRFDRSWNDKPDFHECVAVSIYNA